MTREEINKISLFEPYCFETVGEEIWYQMGCIDGLEAADKEPNTSALWHDASEEPNENTDILFISKNGNVHKVSKVDNSLYSWLTDNKGIKRWAYIYDLLPKTE